MTRARAALRAAATIAIVTALGLPAAAGGQEGGGLPTIESHTAGFERQDGFFPLYWDDDAGTLWLEVGQLGVEVLYINALAAGVGSNDIGLDRGQLGGSRIVRFERVGRKILMVQPNYRYRAATANPDELRAVDDAFATSVLFGFTAAARTGGRVLVDATPFLLRDVHGVADRLPGAYRLDGQRSAVYLPLDEGVSEEHRDGGHADVRAPEPGRRTGFRPRLRRSGRTERRGGHRAAAAVARCAAGRRLCAATLRSAGRLRRRVLRRLRGAARRADDAPLPAPAPPGEARPGRGGQRGGRADRLPPGSRNAGTDPLGPAGRCALVEPGVRGGRVPGRVPGRADAGRSRPARRALQRHPVGAPLDARLELRQLGDRSAYRRDHQGTRHPRFVARAAGLPDRRGTAVALSRRGRGSAGSGRAGAGPDPPVVGSRGRPYARVGAQLLRERPGADLGHGLPAPAGDAGARRADRPVGRLRRRHRGMGRGRDQVRLPGLSGGNGRRGGPAGPPRRRLGRGPALPDESGRRRAPAGPRVGQRDRSGAGARAHAAGAPRGSRPLRRERDSGRPAARDARGGAGAAVPAPPLPDRRGGVRSRRRGPCLRDAGGWPRAGDPRPGRSPTGGPGGAPAHARPGRADPAGQRAAADSAPAAGARPAPRAVPAPHRSPSSMR